MKPMTSAKARAWLFFIVSCICAAALYAPHLNAPLVFDDIGFFNSNYITRCGIGFHGDIPRWWPCWTFAVPRVFLGEDFLHFFRIGNLILHILTANALFFFLKRLFTLLISADKTSPLSIDAMAGVAAMFFLLQPISVYAAQYLVERSILMATLFSLLMLTAHLRGMETHKPVWFFMAVLFCYFSLYSKEHSVMMPFVAALLTIALRDRDLPWRTLGFTFTAYALLSLSVVYRVKSLIGSTYEPETANILAQLAAESALPHNLHLVSVLGQSLNFFKYIFFWFVPITSRMSIDMQQSIVDTSAQPLYWLAAAAYIAWCVAGLRLVFRRGMPALLGFAMAAPALLYATEFASIRLQEPFVLYRSYLWAPALFAATPLLLYRIRPKYILFIGTIVCAGLTTLSYQRLTTFDSPYVLWNEVILLNEKEHIRTPMLARSYTSRGLALLEAKHPQHAIEDFDRAIGFSHRFILAIHGRGLALIRLKRYAEARANFDQVLAIKPDFIQSMLARSDACSKMGDRACADSDLKEACHRGAALACYLLHKKEHPEDKTFILQTK